MIVNYMKNLITRLISDEKGEINMIAIVLILIVVVVLAVIFKDGIEGLLKTILKRVENDVNNF